MIVKINVRQYRSAVLDYTRVPCAHISRVFGHLVSLLVQFVCLSFDNKALCRHGSCLGSLCTTSTGGGSAFSSLEISI